MRVILILLLSAAGFGCSPFVGQRPRSQPSEYVADQLHDIRKAIDAYRASTGELPLSLSTVCPELRGSGACPFWSSGDSLLDPWRQPFIYRLVDGEYLLGSAGPDATAGTADDLLIRPSIERTRVAAAAGCYLIDLAWLSGLERDTILRLDTKASARYGYQAFPKITRYFDPPLWRPLGQDSVLVEWVQIHHAAQLRLAVLPDALTGIARATTGAASWRGRPFRARPVGGKRVPCPAQ